MLIRPVFYKLLGIVLGKDTDMSSLDGLINLSSQCLEAAKCNMRIVTTLSNTGRLGKSRSRTSGQSINRFSAKYGFYDSLHLFSGIKILSLSRLVNTIRPLSLIQEPQDLSLYSAAKGLLLTMASCGNLASKGHLQMLEEIERVLDLVSQSQDAHMLNFRLEEIFPWIDPIRGSGTLLDMSAFPQTPVDFETS
jgi:proline utilization trans-activator